MGRIETDICVIGAGSGGLSVAAGAVQMGARVVLIEAGEMGGDCLNAGCVPSKALIAAAKAAEAQRRGFRGVAGVVPAVDFGTVKDHVRAVIDQIAPVDSQERFEGLGCTVIRAFARFTGPREVQAGDKTIRARRFVIATGSRPFVPNVQGIETVPYLTNETIFDLRERPRHLIVIGGGPIGVEMAQAHRRLGSEVTVIEAARVLGREDPELAASVTEALQAEGITLVEGQPVVRLAGEPGAVEATLGDGRQVRGSHLLVAVGRKVALDGMNLEAAGVAWTARGITVDKRLRSSNRRVYAVGDAAGGPQFTHVAGWHAGIVIRQAVLGLPAKAEPKAIPRATYTDPELAQVGLTEAEARAAHGDAVT
ncbi:MAG: dihydrolipoyl dehydrogenase family protein, partial [Tabrizicola sp.]